MFRTIVVECFGTSLGKRGERLVVRAPARKPRHDEAATEGRADTEKRRADTRTCGMEDGQTLGKRVGRARDDESGGDDAVGRRKRDEEEIPLFRVGEIVLPSRGVSISTDLVEEVVRRGIPITFVTPRGQPYAMLTSPMLTATIATRRGQLRAMDGERGAELARAFVTGKLRNQASLLVYFAKALRSDDADERDTARESSAPPPAVGAQADEPMDDRDEEELGEFAPALGDRFKEHDGRDSVDATADAPSEEHPDQDGDDGQDDDDDEREERNVGDMHRAPDQDLEAANGVSRRAAVLRAAAEVRAARKNALTVVTRGKRPDFVRETLMGIEGSAARAYWRGVRALLEGRAVFEGRGGRGATDPANALLNYGYGILASRVWAALMHAGLDPFAGMLHADRSGKPSLVLDLMEELRAPAVDRAVLAHLRLGKPVRFDGRLLEEATRRAIADAVIERLEARVTVGKERLQLASIIQRQARAIACHVRGEEPYRSFSMTW